MRYIWLTFLGLAIVIGLVSWLRRPAAPAPAGLAPATPAALVADSPASATAPTSLPPPTGPDAASVAPGGPAANPVADSLVQFALRQLGTPYRWAGTTPAGGFDCSGFLLYAYAHVGVPVPHSTALLIDAGRPVPRAEARPGDLVVFTGTARTSTTPGHAGIVISPAGEVPLRFVHSSSARRESGVKISQVEGSDYERRFMQVRRMLSGEQLSPKQLDRLAETAPARRRIVAVVSPEDARPPAVQVADETEPARPAALRAAPRQRRAALGSRAARIAAAKTRKAPTKATARPTARRRASKAKANPKRSAKPAAKAPKARAKAKARPAARRKRR
ncbi:C40 family peptidase [uncultured Hymenobacter sp.]|uniref:C40 family peptidase n=1 Tax=uncultured Hymenobacter sp. TaxID=170016 RepID=UPI0035C9DFDA